MIILIKSNSILGIMDLRKAACVSALVLGLGSCGTGTYLWGGGPKTIGQGMMTHYAKLELLAKEEEKANLDQYLNPDLTTKQKVGYGLTFLGYVFLLSSLGLSRKEDELGLQP